MAAVRPRADDQTRRSGTGLDSNVAGALAYLFGFVSGAILLLVEREDESVRWHAAQSVAVFAGLLGVNVALTLVGVVSGLLLDGPLGALFGSLLALAGVVVALAALVAWGGLTVTTYRGGRVRVPVAAALADRYG
jgi:uncharacterized membrane protein